MSPCQHIMLPMLNENPQNWPMHVPICTCCSKSAVVENFCSLLLNDREHCDPFLLQPTVRAFKCKLWRQARPAGSEDEQHVGGWKWLSFPWNINYKAKHVRSRQVAIPVGLPRQPPAAHSPWRKRLNLCFLQPSWVHNANGTKLCASNWRRVGGSSVKLEFFPTKFFRDG